MTYSSGKTIVTVKYINVIISFMKKCQVRYSRIIVIKIRHTETIFAESTPITTGTVFLP